MQKHTYTRCLSVALGVLLSIAPILLPEAFAQSTTPALTSAMSLLTTVYGFVIYIMFHALYVLNLLIDPNIVLAFANSQNSPLLQIWQFSRDAVNIMFAGLLVGVALYTVVTAKLELVKANIQKFILAVILVNFSWFGPRVVLDFANVLTASIYSVANEIGGDCVYDPGVTGSPLGGNECWVINEITPYNASTASNNNPNPLVAKCYGAASFVGPLLPASATNPRYIIISNNICAEVIPLDNDNYAHVFQGMLVNYTHILYSGQLTTNNISTVANSAPNAQNTPINPNNIGLYVEFATKLFLNFSLTIALAFPIMAMAVIFVVRILIVWITTAFMPFAFIGFLAGDKMGENNPMKIWTYFWQNAMVPAVMAVPITVGFIMIKALTNSGQASCLAIAGANPNVQKLCNQQTFNIIGVKTWMDFIWYLMAIGIVYFGFFTVIKSNKIADKIGGFFKSMGDFAMKAPLALPIIPMGGSKPNSSVLQGVNMVKPTALQGMLMDGKLDGSDFNVGGQSQASKARQAYQDMSRNDQINFNGDLEVKIKNAVANPNDATKLNELKTFLRTKVNVTTQNDLREFSKIDSKIQAAVADMDKNKISL